MVPARYANSRMFIQEKVDKKIQYADQNKFILFKYLVESNFLFKVESIAEPGDSRKCSKRKKLKWMPHRAGRSNRRKAGIVPGA